MKRSFTLAEVLITLGIIGVVAAMTLPALIHKQNEKADVVRLKKVYSMLNQALLAEISENGPVDTWGLAATDTGTADDDGKLILDNSGREALANIFKKHLKVIAQPDTSFQSVKTFNMSGVENESVATDYNIKNRIFLADGSIVKFGYVENQNSCKNADWCADIAVYLKSKKSYTQGRDMFYFAIGKERILPAGMQGSNIMPFETHCKHGVNKRENGRGCTAWVILNENMDYLHCDGLSWDGKTKCN